MPTCPICAWPLETQRHREGLYYVCVLCRGRALSVPHLRKIAGDRFAAKVLRLMRLETARGVRGCSFCGKPMKAISVGEPPIQLEGCLACNAVWFDAPTFESLNDGVVETTNSLANQATEIFAEIKLKELKDREREEEEKARKRKKRIRDL